MYAFSFNKIVLIPTSHDFMLGRKHSGNANQIKKSCNQLGLSNCLAILTESSTRVWSHLHYRKAHTCFRSDSPLRIACCRSLFFTKLGLRSGSLRWSEANSSSNWSEVRQDVNDKNHQIHFWYYEIAQCYNFLGVH